MKLNFATRRRDGFKFKGGSYLIGSDRSRPSRFLLAVASRAKELPPPPPLFFKKTIPYLPTACEVAALRAGLFGAVAPHVSKFDILKVLVSATQICKIDFKFKRKKLRRSIVR